MVPYTTDYYTVGVNTTQEIEEGVWELVMLKYI